MSHGVRKRMVGGESNPRRLVCPAAGCGVSGRKRPLMQRCRWADLEGPRKVPRHRVAPGRFEGPPWRSARSGLCYGKLTRLPAVEAGCQARRGAGERGPLGGAIPSLQLLER